MLTYAASGGAGRDAYSLFALNDGSSGLTAAVAAADQTLNIGSASLAGIPPKKENAQNQDMVMDSLNLFLNSKKPLLEPEPKKESPFYLTLLKDEIKEKTQKPKMNTSFKQRKVFKNRHTKRSLSDM